MENQKPQMKIVGGTNAVGDEELRQWFVGYVKDHPHLTTPILSRTDHIGVSRAALDAYINGTYFLSKEQGGMGVKPATSQVENKIRAYRESVEGVVRGGVKNTYLETRLWQQFQYLCQTAITQSSIVVGYGKPGLGKSRALQQYKTEKLTTMPIEILCSRNITPKYFAEKIAIELGIDARVPLAKLEDLIIAKLKKGSPRLLIVDQANYLDEKALGTICYIWEKTRMPIVLIGTKDLFDLFMQSTLTEDVRVQLSSRISWHCAFSELSIGELKSIVDAMLGRWASTEVVKQIYELTHGNHRHLEMILPRVQAILDKNEDDINTGKTPVEMLVQHAAKRLMIG